MLDGQCSMTVACGTSRSSDVALIQQGSLVSTATIVMLLAEQLHVRTRVRSRGQQLFTRRSCDAVRASAPSVKEFMQQSDPRRRNSRASVDDIADLVVATSRHNRAHHRGLKSMPKV